MTHRRSGTVCLAGGEKTTGRSGAAASSLPTCCLHEPKPPLFSLVNHLPVSALCYKNSSWHSSYLPQHRHQWPLSPERSTTACHLQVLQRFQNNINPPDRENAKIHWSDCGKRVDRHEGIVFWKKNKFNGSIAPAVLRVEHYWNFEALQHPVFVRKFLFFHILLYSLSVIETMPDKNHYG